MTAVLLLLPVALAAGWVLSGRIPGRVHSVRRVWSVVCGGAVALAVYPLQVPKDYNFFFGDEMIVVSVAQRLADGAVLYRDVWEFLQPGSFMLLAFVFRIFGDGIGVFDGCAVLLFGIIAALLHRLVAQLVSPRAAWLTVAAFLLVLFPIGVWLSPHWMSTAAALGALVCLLRHPPPGRASSLVCAGALIGVTFLFQQHKGVFLAAALGTMYVVLCLVRRASGRETVRAVGWLLAGAAVAAAPLVLWLTARGLWGEWWYATFTWVREGYGPANTTRPDLFPLRTELPWGTLVRGLWVGADLTLLRVLPLAYVVAPMTLLFRGPGVERWRVALVWAGALGVFGTALTRYESLRLLYTAPATLVLAAVTVERLRAALPPARRGVTHMVRVAAAGTLALVLCVATAQQYAAHLRQYAGGQRTTVPSPHGPVTLWSQGPGSLPDVHTIVAALQALPRDTRLFVYPSGWGFGYLSGLRNGTPYHFVLAEYTRPAQWDRLDRAFAEGRVDYVVWDRTFSPAWMRAVYPTLPPASVWDHPFPRSLGGPGFALVVETPTLQLYRRTAPDPPAP